jgi:hypothetical protein
VREQDRDARADANHVRDQGKHADRAEIAAADRLATEERRGKRRGSEQRCVRPRNSPKRSFCSLIAPCESSYPASAIDDGIQLKRTGAGGGSAIGSFL